jgi:hypothetical protein
MMLMPFIHRYPRLFWTLLAASLVTLTAGLSLLFSAA